SSHKLARWLYFDMDLTSQHVNKGSFTNALSLLNKAYLGFDFQVAKKFSISTGVTLNAYLTRKTFTDYPSLFTYYTPSSHSVSVSTRNTMAMWLGAKVGLRFL
ncbi:MAG TPA: hypothetical protein PKC10_06105, partial [Cyclobacteriaceae bacterium]|nr:hypothetical protein [Cyclobacteriaceae bacterium]